MDLQSLLHATVLSLAIAVVATVLAGLAAIPLSFMVARRSFKGRSAVEGLLLLPLVLPPTVVGYLILIVLGRRGVVGQTLYAWFHYSILMRFEGAVLAAAIVAFPLFYIPARAAFSGVDRELEDVAKLFGATRRQLFFQVSMPLAARGLFAGAILAFARALGEFGATLMVYTWQPGHETLPLYIYADYEYDNLGHAMPAVVLLSVLSLALILIYNYALPDRRR